MSESVAGHLHSVSTAASAEGIRLDVAPGDRLSLHVEFGPRFLQSMQSFANGGRGPHSFQQLTDADHQQCAAGSSIRNATAPRANASVIPCI